MDKQREIKFRIWDKQEKKFFQPTYEAYKGNLEDLSIGLNGIVFKRTFPEPSSMIDWQDGRWIVNQFTGLKDKNGKEIFEGDILRDEEATYEVYFAQDACAFDLLRLNDGSNMIGFGCYTRDIIADLIQSSKLIGNRFENPKLIKN